MALTLINSLSIPPNTIVEADILNDSVTADKLANSINAEITANTAKVTNATHTGDVTGATALTIAANAVNISKLAVSDGTTGQFLKTDGNGALGFATVSLAYSDWDVKTDTDYTAVNKDQIIMTSASAHTLTLPAGTIGHTIVIHNTGAGTVTVARTNAEKINSTADNGELLADASTQLVYVSAAIGWKEI